MDPCSNKKERVPAGAHSQNLFLSSPIGSYENSYGPHIGECLSDCNWKPCRGAAALSLAALLFAAAPGATLAQAGGLFAGLEGAWSGEGSAKLADGSTASLKCRATYEVSGGGDHLDQSLDCASGRQAFAFRIALDQTNGSILGNWRELTRQVQGGVEGRGGPGRIELAARTAGFAARATVVTSGGRQTLAIASSGGGFSSASIVLRRGR